MHNTLAYRLRFRSRAHALNLSIHCALAALTLPAQAQQTSTASLPEVKSQDSATDRDGAAIGYTPQLNEVQVIGSRAQSGYREAEATAGTKVSAPLKDLPLSIQVLPRHLIDDQSAFRPHDLLQNVSGVYRGNAVFGDSFIFRGFSSNEFLRDGFPDRRGSIRDSANVEQVEVLKGPASVLYGRIEPGGTLNYVTKKPLFIARNAIDIKTDSFGMVRPTVDLSSVSDDNTLGLRLNAALENGPGFRDHSFSSRKFFTGALAWRLSKATQLSIETEAMDDRRLLDRGVPRFGNGPAAIPVTRLISEPDDDRVVAERLFGYTVDHTINPSWQLKHALRTYTSSNQDHRTRFLQSAAQIAGSSSFNGVVNRDLLLRDGAEKQLTAQVELAGDVQLAGMRHQVLFGLDVDRLETTESSQQANTIVASNSINIYHPVYGNFKPVGMKQSALANSAISSNALYVQDLLELAPQWKALVGARYDAAKNTSSNQLTQKWSGAETQALSPRAGIVWQPTQELSLYASSSTSFVPVIGQDFAGKLFEPTLGKQVELGVKSEWFGGRLAASAAVFRVQKTNISVADPVNAGFSIQTGEITSDGLEFDVSGSPINGLNLIGNFALTDARITQEKNLALLGKRPPNTPSRGAGLWASYDMQGAGWKGWGAGLGAHYVGERAGDETASFLLPDYVRWDASVWYRASQWRVALKLENLADKVYSSLGIYPGTPRNLTLSSTYRF